MIRVLAPLLCMLLLTGCIQKIAVNVTSGLFAHGIDALFAEPDLEIAEVAVMSNLKLLEGFHRADPGHKDLLEILAMGYASYSLGFLEETQPERASLFYLRARDYGYKLLETTGAFKDGIPEKEAEFKERLKKIKKSELPGLFWTAFAWSGWINLNRDNPQAVFELGIVKAMMNRVLELDESFFFGGAHLFWGSIDGSIPKMLGGDPEKAKNHFEKAIQLSDEKFMIAYVYYAQFYAATTLNEELFDELLNKVLAAPHDIHPGYELMTSVAKARAQRLMDRRDDLL